MGKSELLALGALLLGSLERGSVQMVRTVRHKMNLHTNQDQKELLAVLVRFFLGVGRVLPG